MALGIWGGVALVAGILAAILALLLNTVGLITTLSIAFVVICILMMLIILAQKPKGGGLSGAFGGAGGGSTQTAFGAKTGDVMTWSTIVLFILFLTVAMGLTWATRPAPEITAPVINDVAPAEAVGTQTDAAMDTTTDATTDVTTDATQAAGDATDAAADTTPNAPAKVVTPAAPQAPASTPASTPASATPQAPASESTP